MNLNNKIGKGVTLYVLVCVLVQLFLVGFGIYLLTYIPSLLEALIHFLNK